jgi:hypothetical protein
MFEPTSSKMRGFKSDYDCPVECVRKTRHPPGGALRTIADSGMTIDRFKLVAVPVHTQSTQRIGEP